MSSKMDERNFNCFQFVSALNDVLKELIGKDVSFDPGKVCGRYETCSLSMGNPNNLKCKCIPPKERRFVVQDKSGTSGYICVSPGAVEVVVERVKAAENSNGQKNDEESAVNKENKTQTNKIKKFTFVRNIVKGTDTS